MNEYAAFFALTCNVPKIEPSMCCKYFQYKKDILYFKKKYIFKEFLIKKCVLSEILVISKSILKLMQIFK